MACINGEIIDGTELSAGWRGSLDRRTGFDDGSGVNYDMVAIAASEHNEWYFRFHSRGKEQNRI